MAAHHIFGPIESLEVGLSQVELPLKQGDRLLVDITHQGFAFALEPLNLRVAVFEAGAQFGQTGFYGGELVEGRRLIGEGGKLGGEVKRTSSGLGGFLDLHLERPYLLLGGGAGGFEVVAAGISEALVATGAGLFVAIVALMFFNYLQVKAGAIAATYARACERFVQALLYMEAEPVPARAQSEATDGELVPAG